MKADSSNRCVLVAEDQEDLRVMIGQLFREEGCEVEEFADGAGLLHALTTRFDQLGVPPDLVVCDLKMPGCSGFEVLAQLRRFDRVTPVILITAFGDEAAHATALQLGAACLIDKPFDLSDLREAAQTHGGLA